jgi:MFS superfamily sulfate permease-like transporter
MKKLLTTIFYPISWILDNLVELIMGSMIIAIVTIFELYVFHIPEKYGDIIWIGNTIITILVFTIGVNWIKKDYRERLEEYGEIVNQIRDGSPTDDEISLYYTELRRIDEKYSGQEAYNKIREFIVKRRAESTLNKIKKKQ